MKNDLSSKPFLCKKHVILCKSGVVKYSREEVLGMLNQDLIEKLPEKDEYSFYRPPSVIIEAKEKMKNLPVTSGHPSEDVTEDNWKELVGGVTGENIDVVVLEDDELDEFSGEKPIGIKTTITFYDKSLYEDYKNNKEQVSLGCGIFIEVFDKEIAEQKGIDGLIYEIYNVNHLALCYEGRCGSYVCVTDSVKKDKKNLTKKNNNIILDIERLFMGNDKEEKENLLVDVFRKVFFGEKHTNKAGVNDSKCEEEEKAKTEDGEEKKEEEKKAKTEDSEKKEEEKAKTEDSVDKRFEKMILSFRKEMQNFKAEIVDEVTKNVLGRASASDSKDSLSLRDDDFLFDDEKNDASWLND